MVGPVKWIRRRPGVHGHSAVDGVGERGTVRRTDRRNGRGGGGELAVIQLDHAVHAVGVPHRQHNRIALVDDNLEDVWNIIQPVGYAAGSVDNHQFADRLLSRVDMPERRWNCQPRGFGRKAARRSRHRLRAVVDNLYIAQRI